MSYTHYIRRKTNTVNIGGILMGSDYPIRIQSMTNTPTADIDATAKQIASIKKAGADYARVTVPTLKEAEGLQQLVFKLGKLTCDIPVIADIHFNPRLAYISAGIVSKVRINPGNFVDKTGIAMEYSPDEYSQELFRLRTKFQELITICQKNNTAIRIGTNHGSLSNRIMSRYGDTPEGMAESAMEFLCICKEEDFNNVVVSMKASNTRIMVYATRILVNKMNAKGMHYPLHLGVTEAGEGEDGRIKSAVGIGTLLADGIGDTIRVSLTEDPELEIPVAQKMVDYIASRNGHDAIPEYGRDPITFIDYNPRVSKQVEFVGGKNQPVVVKEVDEVITEEILKKLGWNYTSTTGWSFSDLSPDLLVVNNWNSNFPVPKDKIVITKQTNDSDRCGHITKWVEFVNQDTVSGITMVNVLASDLDISKIKILKKSPNTIIVLETDNTNGFADQRSAIFRLMNANCEVPVILKRQYNEQTKEDFQLKASVDLGGIFIDGLADGIWLENSSGIPKHEIVETAFGILQASRLRFSKTEYISCPSCGRTLFDLQDTTQKIRERTSHLKGLKIGIMGCIVNGPGEMADANYGYVGAGNGKVTLYKAQEIMKKNISEDKAVEELINLIKENGDWVEP